MSHIMVTFTAACKSVGLESVRESVRLLTEKLSATRVSVTVSHDSADGDTLERVMSAVTAAFGVTRAQLIMRNNSRSIAFARHAYCHLAKGCGFSLEEIGSAIHRHHATVVHSVRESKNILFSRVASYVNAFNAAKTTLEQQIAQVKYQKEQQEED